MLKKREAYRILILLLLVGMLCGCGRYSVSEPLASPEGDFGKVEEKKENEEGDVFAEAEADSEIVVQYEHGAKNPNRNKDGEIIPFEYNGGELSMEYEFSAKAKGKSIGFYIFINGKPQAYRIDNNKAEEYLHIFEILEEDTEQDFTFHFTPAEGKKGNTLNIVVLSVFHPAFQPDMIHTQGYGFYHNCLPDSYQLKMNVDASGNTSAPEKKIIVKNIGQKMEKITNEFIEEELSGGMVDVERPVAETLEEDLRTTIRYDGEEVLNGLDISGKEKIHCDYKICGCPGVIYRTTFFANHQPVSETIETELTKGDVAVTEADIDVSCLDGNSTFYAVTVPDIYERESDKMLCTIKSHSVLFYGGTPKTETDSGRVNEKSAEEESSKEGIGNKKVTDVFYGKDFQLLIQVGKRLYAYDVKNKKVEGETDISGYEEGFSVQRYEEGYVLIGKEVSESSSQNGGMVISDGKEDAWKWKTVFYDFDLKKKREILLSDIFGKKLENFDGDNIAVSHDGKKIAVIGENEHIYLYCSGQKKVRKIWKGGKKVTVDGIETKLGFYKIAFAADDSSIIYMGASFSETETEEEGIPAWGMLSLSGEVQTLARDASYHPEEMYVYPESIVLPEEFEHTSGRLLKTDMKNGKKIFMPFSDKKEGKDGVYVSSGGRYFATACLEKQQVVVRVYDMEKGTLLGEKTLEDKKEEYFYRCPLLFILDDSRSCIVFMGAGIEEVKTKVEQFTF